MIIFIDDIAMIVSHLIYSLEQIHVSISIYDFCVKIWLYISYFITNILHAASLVTWYRCGRTWWDNGFMWTFVETVWFWFAWFTNTHRVLHYIEFICVFVTTI